MAMIAALAATLGTGAWAEERRLVALAEEPVTARVLDVAFARNGRVVVLMDGALALYRHTRRGLERLDERPLPAVPAVRAPAGIVAADPADDTCWVATNRGEGATLYSLDGDRLWEVERAAVALPWPDAPRGVSFRPGTNLIEADVAGLGPGPFVRVGRGWAIGNDARLLVSGSDAPPARVGFAAARIGPRAFVVSDPVPPGANDRLSIVEAGSAAVRASLPVAGAVTAIAAVTRDGETAIVAGVARDGAARLMLVGVGDAAR
jgi:hypothetical protein